MDHKHLQSQGSCDQSAHQGEIGNAKRRGSQRDCHSHGQNISGSQSQAPFAGQTITDQQHQHTAGNARCEKWRKIGIAEGRQAELGEGLSPGSALGIHKVAHRPIGQKLQNYRDYRQDQIRQPLFHKQTLHSLICTVSLYHTLCRDATDFPFPRLEKSLAF